MQNQADDVTGFRDFVIKQVEENPTGVTPENLLREWRRNAEHQATAEDFRQGLAEVDAGKGEPFRDVLERIRVQLGLPS